MELILGSQSPRRRELMAGLNLPFTAITIEADESFPPELQAADIPLYISRAKARAYVNKLADNQLLITADTIVWCNGKMLGKPADEQEARQMLQMLSNNTHQVYTAVTLVTKNGEVDAFVDRTDVTFRELTDNEIDFYIANRHPMDKAGAYGIQEWIGYTACTHLDGSYFNVMGFPTHRLYEILKEKGCI
jgi:septum formation protein